MKLIIDIPEWKYKSICEGVEASRRCGVVGIDPDIHEAIYNGKLYEERPQGDLISREALKERLKEMFDTFDVILFDDIIATIDNAPTVNKYIHIDDVYRLIAGHSDYHGDNILSAFTCLAEGKEVSPIKPIDIDNAPTVSDRYGEGYAQGYIDGITGADWKGGAK